MSDNVLFPAHAGMNRSQRMIARAALAVPRTRGDEPGLRKRRKCFRCCSPHTRG